MCVGSLQFADIPVVDQHELEKIVFVVQLKSLHTGIKHYHADEQCSIGMVITFVSAKNSKLLAIVIASIEFMQEPPELQTPRTVVVGQLNTKFEIGLVELSIL